MRNITVSIDDETYRRVRIRAAELDTSVSALVRDSLRSLIGEPAEEGRGETEVDRRRRLFDELTAELEAQGGGFSAGENLSRDELYDRGRARAEAAEDARKRQGGATE